MEVVGSLWKSSTPYPPFHPLLIHLGKFLNSTDDIIGDYKIDIKISKIMTEKLPFLKIDR